MTTDLVYFSRPKAERKTRRQLIRLMRRWPVRRLLRRHYPVREMVDVFTRDYPLLARIRAGQSVKNVPSRAGSE